MPICPASCAQDLQHDGAAAVLVLDHHAVPADRMLEEGCCLRADHLFVSHQATRINKSASRGGGNTSSNRKKMKPPALDTSSCHKRSSNDHTETPTLQNSNVKPMKTYIHIYIYNSKMKFYARRAVALEAVLKAVESRCATPISVLDVTARDVMRCVLDSNPPFQSVNRRILATPLKRMELREDGEKVLDPVSSWRNDSEVRWDLMTCLILDDRVGIETDGTVKFRARPIKTDDYALKLWALEDELDDETIAHRRKPKLQKVDSMEAMGKSIFRPSAQTIITPPPRRRSSLQNFVQEASHSVPLANWIRKRLNAGADLQLDKQRIQRITQACTEGKLHLGICIDDGSHPNRKNLRLARSSSMPFWFKVLLDWITSMSVVLLVLFFFNPTLLNPEWTRWQVLKVSAYANAFRLLLLPSITVRVNKPNQPRNDGKRTQFGSLDDKRLSPQLISMHINVPEQTWNHWVGDQIDKVVSAWETGIIGDATDGEEMELFKSLPKWWQGSRLQLWEPGKTVDLKAI